MISWSRARRAATRLVATTFALCLSAAQTGAATSVDEQAVLDTVQRFFDAMADRDVDSTSEVVFSEGRFFSIREEDGVKVIRSFTNQEYMEGLADREPNVVERMWDPEVRIHGGVATVWTPYDFYLDGEFHHCGIDAFDLVNDGTGWKITGGVYTVETSGCAQSPLGPPAPHIP
jgi:hypothetical protein